MAMPNPALWHRLESLIEIQGRPAPQTQAVGQPSEAESVGTPALADDSTTVQVAPLGEPNQGVAPSAGPKRIGEVVLLSMLALGEDGPGQALPLVMHQVLRSLMAVGLHDDARALSMEAAIQAGL